MRGILLLHGHECKCAVGRIFVDHFVSQKFLKSITSTNFDEIIEFSLSMLYLISYWFSDESSTSMSL